MTSGSPKGVATSLRRHVVGARDGVDEAKAGAREDHGGGSELAAHMTISRAEEEPEQKALKPAPRKHAA